MNARYPTPTISKQKDSMMNAPKLFPITFKSTTLRTKNHAPCLAFSAQISAIIRDNSALCSNCSRLTSSLASDAAISLPVFSMRFCKASIFASVLSRKGAENLTPSAPELGRRISSFRGGFLPFTCCGSGAACFL